MKKTILVSLCAIILFSIVACALIIFGRLLYLDTYKDHIVAAVEKALKRRVTYENGTFSFRDGPIFTFTKVTVMERDGTSIFVSSDQLVFRVAMLPLLEKKLIMKEVQLEHPYIRLERDKSGKFNFSDILEGKKEEIPLRIGSIRVRNGSAILTDQAISREKVTTSLENLDLFVSRITRGKSSDFRLSVKIAEKGGKSALSLNGTARLSPKDKRWSDTNVSMSITARSLVAAHYWDYYSRYVPFQKIFGRIDMDSTFQGKLSDFSSKGTLRLSSLYFNYPGVFHAPLTPKEVRIKYDMELTPKDIAVKHLALNVDKLSVKGSCSLKDIHSGNLFLSAKATTNSFRLEEFGTYIPYGIIPADTSGFIEKHIKGGTYRLQEGKLEGRISQIAHMEMGTNYNVLSIKGTVDRGLVSFGADTPAFDSIRGNLALRGKDFILSGMEGRFGSSPFKLDGKITDYPIKIPSGYPFTMTMIPEQAEVLWLLDHKKTGNLAYIGETTLRLTGNGYTSNYTLSGKWDLTTAAYKYADIINKPKGQSNNLSFTGSINKDEAKVAGLHYVLNSLSLNAGGTYRLTGEKQLAFSANSNQFQIQEIAPMVPKVGKYLPKGGVKAAIQGKYTTTDPGSLRLNGDVSLSEVSLKPTENMKRLENINGDIRFTGDSLQTSMLTTRLGNTIIRGSGSLTGYRNPLLDMEFSSPVLDFSDIGLHSKTKMPPAQNVRGSIHFKDGSVQIKSLSGQINKSVINIHGTVEDIRNPKVSLSITSPYLEWDDIMLLKGLGTATKKGEPPTGVSGQVIVHVDSGRIKQFSFTKLKTVLQLRDKAVYLQPIDLNLLGGTVSAKGLADFSTTGKPHYHLNFDLKNLSAIQLMQSLKARREVTGSISLQGEIAAEGEDLKEIKKTASGSIKLDCTEGSLRKFAVLSKIFSILNVSQLLKFHLPDMVSGGMPYNKITGTFALQNGVAATNDLFIDSDAMNISVIGKFDLPKEELHLTVGVKPLQTVDKIVSRLPIVGWVLTGSNKSLVTAYFEAKGSWENPQVRAIPVKSLAKGVFGIFKRVFQLPAKLITDTGEVIVGK